MQNEDRLVDLELSEKGFDRLIECLEDEGLGHVDEVWREIAEAFDPPFYPSTVEWDSMSGPKFRARPVEKFHTIKDIEDDGWSFNDFLLGWGAGEHWRIRLNRKLTDMESRRMIPRMSEGIPSFDDMIVVFTTLCASDLEMIKARKAGPTGEIITAVRIEDKWRPVWPEPEDTEIEIR